MMTDELVAGDRVMTFFPVRGWPNTGRIENIWPGSGLSGVCMMARVRFDNGQSAQMPLDLLTAEPPPRLEMIIREVDDDRPF